MGAPSNVFLTLSESMFEEISDTSSTTGTSPSSAYGTGAKNLPGGIEVLSFGFSIEQIGSEDEAGRPRNVEKIARSDLEITKAADSRSPKLFIMCCRNEMISNAKLKIFGPRYDRPYLTYEMQGVHISKYAPSGGGDLTTETIGLRFNQMRVKFDNAGIGTSRNGNGRAGTVTEEWNWIMEVAGFTPVPTGTVTGGL